MHTRTRSLIAAFAATLLIGGCSDVTPAHSDHVDNPLSDSESRAQVVDPLAALVSAMNLDVVLASFTFDSCNDQNEAPFRGRSSANFTPPAGTTPTALRQQIHDTLIASQGWADGPPPGKTLYGLNVHKGQMMAVLTINDEQTTIPGTVSIDVFGECRDIDDHGVDKNFEKITDELRSAR